MYAKTAALSSSLAASVDPARRICSSTARERTDSCLSSHIRQLDSSGANCTSAGWGIRGGRRLGKAAASAQQQRG